MAINNSNVTKKDIVEDIALRTGLTQVDTKVIIESFLSSVVKAMSEGNNIEIRGFGRFKIKERKARKARNPKTGEIYHVQCEYCNGKGYIKILKSDYDY